MCTSILLKPERRALFQFWFCGIFLRTATCDVYSYVRVLFNTGTRLFLIHARLHTAKYNLSPSFSLSLSLSLSLSALRFYIYYYYLSQYLVMCLNSIIAFFASCDEAWETSIDAYHPPLPLFFVAVFLAEGAAEPREARGVGEGDRPFMRRLLVFFFSMEIFSAQYM